VNYQILSRSFPVFFSFTLNHFLKVEKRMRKYISSSCFCLTNGGGVFMEKTRLSEKGQIVIPKAVRALHGWKAGLEFVIENVDEGIKPKPIKRQQLMM
jgi:AbrB family looped-hinge helix DNA binding protein